MADAHLGDFRDRGDPADIGRSQSVPGGAVETERAGMGRCGLQAPEFGIGRPAGPGLAIGAGVQLHRRRAQGRGRFDLPKLRIDEEGDPDAIVDEGPDRVGQGAIRAGRASCSATADAKSPWLSSRGRSTRTSGSSNGGSAPAACARTTAVFTAWYALSPTSRGAP